MNTERALSLARRATSESKESDEGAENERKAAAAALAKLIEKEPGILLELEKRGSSPPRGGNGGGARRQKARPSTPEDFDDFIDDILRKSRRSASSWGYDPTMVFPTRVVICKTPFNSTRVRVVTPSVEFREQHTARSHVGASRGTISGTRVRIVKGPSS